MIDKIAQKYNANADEAKAIVGIMPKEDVKNIFILEPGSVVYKTSTGYTIIAPANDPDAPRRVNLINAYLLGLEDGREQRD
ncbi:MAG: hypothetical protein EOP06_24525 [Proteobacteria bacterium]|nr:MAG: hypothetical protein EOP06_24525 [Pseudomonadota bacterium]